MITIVNNTFTLSEKLAQFFWELDLCCFDLVKSNQTNI